MGRGRGRGPGSSSGEPAARAHSPSGVWGREEVGGAPPACREPPTGRPSLSGVPPIPPAHLDSLLPKTPRTPEDCPAVALAGENRSPLRSLGCTAAPEGQTKFGFGETRSGGEFCGSGSPVPWLGSGVSVRLVNRHPHLPVKALVPWSYPPIQWATDAGLFSPKLVAQGRAGTLWWRKGPGSETCPGL